MSNAQKTPLSRTLNKFAANKALDEIDKRGQGLPGVVKSISGQIVTIDFQVSDLTLQPVQMPVATSEYIRLPIQVGDKGVALPASVYLGGVSGLGGGTADTRLRGNLGTLIWFPVGNTEWSEPPNGNANILSMYGNAGLSLLDSLDNNASVELLSSGITLTVGSTTITMTSSSITLTAGGSSILINSSGVKIMNKDFLSHVHKNVQSGSSDSGPVGP